MSIDTVQGVLILAEGYADCPSCKGLGEFQESYRVKGPAARIIDCPDCRGAGYVDCERAAELAEQGPPSMPSGWTP